MEGASKGLYFSEDIVAIEGDNELKFENKGYTPDTIGFKIGNVRVSRVLDRNYEDLVKNLF